MHNSPVRFNKDRFVLPSGRLTPAGSTTGASKEDTAFRSRITCRVSLRCSIRVKYFCRKLRNSRLVKPRIHLLQYSRLHLLHTLLHLLHILLHLLLHRLYLVRLLLDCLQQGGVRTRHVWDQGDFVCSANQVLGKGGKVRLCHVEGKQDANKVGGVGGVVGNAD